MSEIKKQVKTYKIDMVCDKCGKGMMRPIGTVLSTYPAQYPHECNCCGYTQNYYDTYPRVIYEEGEENDN